MNVIQQKCKCFFLIMGLIIVVVSFTGCEMKTVDSKNMSSVLEKEMNIDTELKIRFEGENVNPEIVIETSLPDKTRLEIRLFSKQKDYEIKKTISVLDGQAKTKLLGILDEPLTPGEYSVTAEVRPENQQSDILALIEEDNGEKYLYKEINYTVKETEFLDSNPTENAKMIYLLERAIRQKYGANYRISTKNLPAKLLRVAIWPEDFLKVYEQMSKGEEESNIKAWYEIREELKDFASKLGEIVRFDLIEVNLVPKSNNQEPILTVTGRTVTYDATQKGIPVRVDVAKVDNARIDYTGVIGYIGIEDYPADGAYDPTEDKEFATTVWTVPTYQKDKQFYVINGAIEHKTKVQVVSQDLIDKGNYSSRFYLTVINMETGEESIIQSSNFVTVPYWKIDTISAASIGKYVAEYHQVSDRWPELNETRVEVNEGERILVLGRSGDRIIGLILQNSRWVKCEFDSKDLSIIY